MTRETSTWKTHSIKYEVTKGNLLNPKVFLAVHKDIQYPIYETMERYEDKMIDDLIMIQQKVCLKLMISLGFQW